MSFFGTDKKWVNWVNLWTFSKYWRRRHWCWVTEHIYCFNLIGCIRGHPRDEFRTLNQWDVDVWKMFTHTQYTHFWTVTKSDLSSMVNLWTFSTHLSTCVNWTNWCWVTEQHADVPNVNGKCFTQYISFWLLQNIACVDWTIYSWQGFNSFGC